MAKLTDKQLDEILSALSKSKKNKKKKKRKIKKVLGRRPSKTPTASGIAKLEDPFSTKKQNFLNRNFGGGGGFGNFVPFQQQPVITKVDVLSSDNKDKPNQQMDYFNQQIELIKSNNKKLEDASDKFNMKLNVIAEPLRHIYHVVNNPLSNIRPMNLMRVQQVDRNDGRGIIPRNDSLETLSLGVQDQSYIEDDSLDQGQEQEQEQEQEKEQEKEQEQEQEQELQFIDSDDEIPTPVPSPEKKTKVKFVREQEEDEEEDGDKFFQDFVKELQEDKKKRGRPKGSKNKVKTRSSGDEELVNQDFKTSEQKKGKGKQKKMNEFL